MGNNANNTKVRYVVSYNERKYQYVFHSEKRLFLKNIADVLNIVEFCVTQDLKKNLYKSNENLYNFNVVRMVNDIEDNSSKGDSEKFNNAIHALVDQMIVDNIQRHSN